MVRIATIGPDRINVAERTLGMKALDWLISLWQPRTPHMDAFDVLKEYRQTPPPVSRNSTRTKGRKFASQKERANRRKARAKR